MKDYNRTLQAKINQTPVPQSRTGAGRRGETPRQRSEDNQSSNESRYGHIYSCDEAVRYLSQVEDLARTDSDFVTDVRMGGGGGASNRNRAALVSLEDRYNQQVETLERGKVLIESSYKKRAKALWYKALEGVTTGRLFGKNDDFYRQVNPKFRAMWRLRGAALHWQRERGGQEVQLPVVLTRGWRPSNDNFLEESPGRKRAKMLWKKALRGVTMGQLDREHYSLVQPHFRGLWFWRLAVAGINNMPPMLTRGWNPERAKEKVWKQRISFIDKSWERCRALDWLHQRQPKFYWAYPFALMLSNIPDVVDDKDIRDAVVACLEETRGQSYDSKVDVLQLSAGTGWKAIVYLRNKTDYDHIVNKVKQSKGIELKCHRPLPWLDEKIQEARANYEEAEAARRVHPNALNSQKEAKAKKELNIAMLGLRIFSAKKDDLEGHVSCAEAVGSTRSLLPSSADALYEVTKQQIQEASWTIEENRSLVTRTEKEAERLKSRIDSGIADNVASLTTFETLQALKNKQGDAIGCPICYDILGHGRDSKSLIALTKCGHLCCRGCMDDWVWSRQRDGQSATCMECRKPIEPTDVVSVDPNKTSDQDTFRQRQAEAKSILQQAAKMLDNNHGQLDPHLWEALYLSMDLPQDVNCALHNQYTAIPGRVLGHLRHATQMQIQCKRNEPRVGSMYKLSSKVRALLSDLPRDELSVVFASSKVGVQHILDVLVRAGIGCRGLFTGQTEQDSEIAVSEWQSLDSVLVLVVQAGAAACGLTLTAASKMFLMEPFLKHEEEKQAYARLHRYGQTKEVQCKVYYTPVSVESRLLEWRHRSQNQQKSPEILERTIFAPLRDTATEEQEQESSEEAMNLQQTQFLLGLT